MKTSRRLLFGTFAVLLATPPVLVAYGRFGGNAFRELPAPERTTPAELAALRDFTVINANGDFALEIVRADTYSIDYTPLSPERGNFSASVEDGTLSIEGFNNRTEFMMGTVRIGLPALAALESGYVPTIAVRGFDGDTLDLNVAFTEELVLANNRYATLNMELQRAGLVTMNGNSFGNTRVEHFGTTITTD